MKRLKQILGLSAAAAAVLATGCSSPDLFSEYDDESFLSTTSLSSESWQLMPDYDFETGTNADDYMDFSQVSSSGGPDGGPVYRLEIRNLLANGDFEDGTAAGWYHYDGTTMNDPATGSGEVQMNEGSYTLDNNTLYFDTTSLYRLGIVFNNTNDSSGLSYNSAFINPDTYVDGMSYVYSYSYRTASVISSYFEDNWAGDTTDLPSSSFQALGGTDGSDNDRSYSNYNYFPPLDPDLAEAQNYNVITADNSSDMDSFFFTSTSTQAGYIDDVTFVRDSQGDFDLRLRLKLDIDHRSDLDLIPGYYRFSVYVKAENSATNNVFDADRVELGINGYDEDNNMSYEGTQVYYKTSTLHNLYSQSGDSFQGNWSSSWVKLVFETDQTVQLPDISTDPVMELTISPSNPGSSDNAWNRLDAGSILIAEPTLEYSDGPW